MSKREAGQDEQVPGGEQEHESQMAPSIPKGVQLRRADPWVIDDRHLLGAQARARRGDHDFGGEFHAFAAQTHAQNTPRG
jgi:hypothetical protein